MYILMFVVTGRYRFTSVFAIYHKQLQFERYMSISMFALVIGYHQCLRSLYVHIYVLICIRYKFCNIMDYISS